MTQRLTIIANWKMNKTVPETVDFLDQLELPHHGSVDVIICPPFTALDTASKMRTIWTLGAQDVSASESGAHTGDISAAMLSDCGVGAVIIGHSERRQQHQESDDLIAQKVTRTISANLIPILCVGERESEREAGQAEAVVENQLTAALKDQRVNEHVYIAYEPVWAIGTGRTATLAQIDEMHHAISNIVATLCGTRLPILYGGSVNADNALEILSLNSVSGALVGGASLNPDSFNRLIEIAMESTRNPVE